MYNISNVKFQDFIRTLSGLQKRKGLCIMQRITIRLPDDLYAALQTIADKNDLTLSELCRIALAGKLNKWCSNLMIIDKKAAEDLKAAILKLCNTTSDLRTDLRAISNSYNRIASPEFCAIIDRYTNATREMQDAIADIYKAVI